MATVAFCHTRPPAESAGLAEFDRAFNNLRTGPRQGPKAQGGLPIEVALGHLQRGFQSTLNPQIDTPLVMTTSSNAGVCPLPFLGRQG